MYKRQLFILCCQHIVNLLDILVVNLLQLLFIFVGFTLCEDEKKYTIEQCKERDATYAAPLKVKVRLHNKENGEITTHEIFMGDLPLMTATGTFVINGAERVIVSQLVRSPGIYYAIAHDKLDVYKRQVFGRAFGYLREGRNEPKRCYETGGEG